ncbi:hypothetical protein OG196_31730 [Kitasatospora purpeofusca]|uniref:hypothetical protein n=1 Tax=Kitasatospora purpeofusca TaxID=67352 RepID=UPI002E0DE120|nr:hypothetical protein OG196_31730 [Kitasatospora purpeofusca]
MYPFPRPDLPLMAEEVSPAAPVSASRTGASLSAAGVRLQVLFTDEGWVLRASMPGTPVTLYGPCVGELRAEAWLNRLAAWWLWPRAHVRGVWGCLALTEEGWFTALAHAALAPEVRSHPDVQAAEERAARHLVSPELWADGADLVLPDAVRRIETQFWVREGYRTLATWAGSTLGSLTREAYRSRELARGNFPTTDLAERLGVSHATVSGAAAGRSWDPPINRARGVLASRGRRI